MEAGDGNFGPVRREQVRFCEWNLWVEWVPQGPFQSGGSGSVRQTVGRRDLRGVEGRESCRESRDSDGVR